MKLGESVFDRREFLNGLAGAGALVFSGVVTEPILGYLTGLRVPEPDHIIVEGSALATLARDRFVLVPYGPEPVMIFQLPNGALRALSAVCTHGQCNVHYSPENNDIRCPCHGGRFNVEGINLPGTPPPRPLRKFEIEQRNDGSLWVAAARPDVPERQNRPDGPLAGDAKG